MHLFLKRRQIVQQVALLKNKEQSIGFVPTMGALHQGHLALIRTALAQNDRVIVSIFVNPTQFNTSNDLAEYPRTLDHDRVLLEKLSDDLMVFAPEPEEIYGADIQSKTYDFGGLAEQMEGKHRPGHFDGVATVLQLLFSLITPTAAYFGEKDFQQLQIVKKMVVIEKIDLKIVGCPIYREASGLAFSSRNQRLSESQYRIAPLIYKVLKEVKAHFGTKSVKDLKDWVVRQFEVQPQLELEYFEIAEQATLQPIIQKEKDYKYRAFIAVFAGEVRLIDNIGLN